MISIFSLILIPMSVLSTHINIDHKAARKLHHHIVQHVPSIKIHIISNGLLQKIVSETQNRHKPKYAFPVDKKIQTEFVESTVYEKPINDLDKVNLLNLTSKGIDKISEVNLASMKNLKELILKKNQMKKFRFCDLPFLPQLEIIDLSFNPLVEIDLNELRKVVPKLDILDISGTKIPDDKIEEYVKKTNCTIVNNKIVKKTPIAFPAPVE